jgi:hypothetical protein
MRQETLFGYLQGVPFVHDSGIPAYAPVFVPADYIQMSICRNTGVARPLGLCGLVCCRYLCELIEVSGKGLMNSK